MFRIANKWVKPQWRSFFVGLLLTVFFDCTAIAQDTTTISRILKEESKPQDTVFPNRNWVPATVKLMLANVLPFSVNYFIRKKQFSFISLQSVSKNLHPSSWQWDADQFLTNQFSHPYHGSMYFNAFRSEGYSFGQSAMAVVAGSLMWEIAGEQDNPAPNDLINTTFGGIAWGEMIHRMGRKFTQNWRSGKRMNLLDVLGIVVDPMEGVSNLSSKKRRQSMSRFIDTTKMDIEFSAGSRQYNREVNRAKLTGKQEVFSRLYLQYGSDVQHQKTPFSYFSLLVEVGTSDSALFFNLAQIRGLLTSWPGLLSKNRSRYSLLTLDYDYYSNTAFSYGMQSAQFSFFSSYQPAYWLAIQGTIGCRLIGLAAVSVDQVYVGSKRNYDYGSGGGLSWAATVRLYKHFSFQTDVWFGWLTTLDGRNSVYRIGNTLSSLKYYWKNRVFLSYEWGNFLFKSWYDGQKSTKHTYYKRIGLGYKFSL